MGIFGICSLMSELVVMMVRNYVNSNPNNIVIFRKNSNRSKENLCSLAVGCSLFRSHMPYLVVLPVSVEEVVEGGFEVVC